MTIRIAKPDASAALAVLLAGFTSTPEGKLAQTAVSVAIKASMAEGKASEETRNLSAWGAWREAAEAMATAGANPAVAVMLINATAGSDSSTQKTIATYRSRAASLVPIFAASDDDFKQLWESANITQSGKPVAATKEFNSAIAQKLIRAASERPASDRFDTLLTAFVDQVKALAKSDAAEGSDAEYKRERKAQRRSEAADLLEKALRAAGLNVPTTLVLTDIADEEQEGAEAVAA